MTNSLILQFKSSLNLSVALDLDQPGVFLHQYEFLTRNTKRGLKASLSKTTKRLYSRYELLRQQLCELKRSSAKGIWSWCQKKRYIYRLERLLCQAKEMVVDWVKKSLTEFACLSF